MKPGLLPKILAPILILIGAVAIAGALIRNKPQAQRTADVAPGALVDVAHALPGEHRLDVHAQGTVQAAREVTVQPQVTGRIVEVAPDLVPGGFFKAGEMLYRIDPDDYQLAVATQNAALEEAQARLALEHGRQRVAQREWELFEGENESAKQDASLALREPQLRQAQAAIETARARLEQAKLDLERTTVVAPFNSFVRSESVELGQTVGPQSQSVRLVGTDTFWVQASVEADTIGYVDVPGVNASSGSEATIRFDAGGREVERDGRVVRLLGDLDPAGRMARLLIEVRDPLGFTWRERGGAVRQLTPLLLDSYVEVSIVGNHSEELLEVPRSWLRDGDRVWVVDDGKLAVRELDVAWRQQDTVLVSGGLSVRDPIVTSALGTPVEGMQLRIAEPANAITSLPGSELPGSERRSVVVGEQRAAPIPDDGTEEGAGSAEGGTP